MAFEWMKRAGLAAVLAVSGAALAVPAQAHDGRRGDGDEVAIAVGAGLVGLAVGALIADRDDDRYWDRGFFRQRRYVRVAGYPDFFYYYDGFPGRYYRDRFYGRGFDPRFDNRWDRGYRRIDRWYGRGGGFGRGYGRGPRAWRGGW